jgi:hypothetical protein
MQAHISRKSVIEDKEVTNDGRSGRARKWVEKIVMIIVRGIVPIPRGHVRIMVDPYIGHYFRARISRS